MANAYKVLGQATCNGATEVYVVPSSTETIISSIVIANKEAATNTFRLYVRPDDETLNDKHHIAYELSIAANDTIILTLGLTMNAADKLYCHGSDANVICNVFGTEIS